MKPPLLTAFFALLPLLLFAELPEMGDDGPDEGNGVMRDGLALRNDVSVPPIQVPKDDERLQRSFRTRQTKWVEAQLLADFPTRNVGSPWLADSVAVLREAAPYLSGEIYKNEQTGEKIYPPASLIARGKAISAAGCDDPLFNLIVPFLESSQSSRTPEQMALAERRLPDLLKGGDSPHLKLFACGWVWGGRYDHRATKDPAKRDAMANEIPRYLQAALDASVTPEDSLGFYQFIHRNQGYVLFYIKWKEAETTAILNKSKAASWLKDTLLGQFARNTAWKLRGSGYANTVTEEGWKGFYSNLAKAGRHFSAAWKANPGVPFAAEDMIAVTMGGAGVDGIDEREWFDRAITACFDYMPAYESLLWAYRPRWGGSHALMLAFGKACANTRRYDTDVPTRLYKAVGAVGSELADRSVLHDDPEICRLTVEIEKATIPYAKSDAEVHYALSYGTCNAFLARDYALAASYYKQLKGPIRPQAENALASYGIPPFEWRGRLAMQADSAIFSDLQRAETAYRKGERASALPIYQRLLQLPTTTSQVDAATLVRHRLAAIAVEQRFAKGDWVRLTDEESKLLWITDTGIPWNAQAEGVLSVRNDKNWVASRVILDARVGLDFELRARLDNPAELAGSQFGGVIGYWPGHTGFATAVCGVTEATPTKRGAALVKFGYDTSEKNPPVALELKPDSAVRIRSHRGQVTLLVDEKEIFTRNLDECFDRRIPTLDSGKEQHRFGFGSRQFRKGESRLKDIEFRLLK